MRGNLLVHCHINTIREVPEQFFEDLKHVIPGNDKLSIFRKHILKQREIDALLANTTQFNGEFRYQKFN